MTENEAIEKLKLSCDSCGSDNCRLCDEALEMASKSFEELEQYRAIGTVEEIKHFFNENRKAGYEHGYADGYAKAIDEFAEKLCTDVESFVAEVNGIKADLLTLDYFHEFVCEVAEQMKAGEENEID